MSIFCPIAKRKVVYLVCQDCDEQQCRHAHSAITGILCRTDEQDTAEVHKSAKSSDQPDIQPLDSRYI